MKLPATGSQFAVLDGPKNWHGLKASSLVERRDGALVLQPLPGAAEPLWEDAPAALVDAAALAVDAEGRLLIADAGANRIHRVTLPHRAMAAENVTELTTTSDPPAPMFETLVDFGGKGSASGQLRAPQGIAALSRGVIAIADTGNERVQLFAPELHSVLDIMNCSQAQPRALAFATCGSIYVAEQSAVPCVRQLARDGVSLGEIGLGELRLPGRLAISAANWLAVVDLDPTANATTDTSAVVIYPPSRRASFCVIPVAQPRAVAFDDTGTLFIGDARGLIHRFAQNPDMPGAFRRAGAGSAGRPGEVIDLVWSARDGLLAIVRAEASPKRADIYRIDPDGACEREGHIILGPLDGLVSGCRWHRVQFKAQLGDDAATPIALRSHCSIKAQALTTDDAPKADTPALEDDRWIDCVASVVDGPDGLVRNRAGRYLWLKLTVRSNGVRTPVINSISAYFPRMSYLDFLPSVFQEDPASRDLLERFLAIFETGFDDFDRLIDDVWKLFDPVSVKSSDYPWLAEWMAFPFEPDWSTETRRERLKRAYKDHPRRGTVEGLTQAIADFAGVSGAAILEHFKLRHWPVLGNPSGAGAAQYWPRHSSDAQLCGSARLFSRGFFGRLQLGEFSKLGVARLASRPDPSQQPFAIHAHRFTVFFPADPGRVRETRDRVKKIVDREKPAHTQADYLPVFPRMRLGVQSRIGFDTLIGSVGPLVLGEFSTLGYDTILSCSPDEKSRRALGIALHPRVGLQTKLL